MIWAAQDRRVLDTSHGQYFRIVIPPPQEEFLDTEVAIGIARDLASEHVAFSPLPTACTAGLSLRQTAARSCVARAPLTCKTDPDSDSTWHISHVPPSRSDAANRANHLTRGNFAPGARSHLEAALERADLVECEEEGRVIYLHTWFIHHRTLPRCYDGRALRLTGNSMHWFDEIADTWADVIHPGEPISIRIVQPQPPCNRFECVQAHLLIEQAASPHLVSGLVSFVDSRGGEHWTHRALSLHHLQTKRSLLDAAELSQFCSVLRCSLTHNDIPLGLFEIDEIGPAWNFVVRTLPNFIELANDTGDFNSLMQAPTFRHTEVVAPPDAPGDIGTCVALERPSPLNPNAPVFVPAQSDITQHPADIQAIYEVWRFDASSWGQETPAAHFIVWFLCPPNDQRRCLYGRRVTLHDNFHQWRERLIFAWRDLITPHVPTGIHLVQPQPQVLEPDITAHIILTQLMPDHESGVLITIADDAVNDAHPFKLAVTLSDPSLQPQVLATTGYATEGGIFTLQREGETIAPDQPFPTRHGYGLNMRVVRPFLQPGWNPPILPVVPGAEGLGLLQTKSALLKSATCVRLTHGQVAHTHGPQDISSFESPVREEVSSLPTVSPRLSASLRDPMRLTFHHLLRYPSQPQNLTLKSKLPGLVFTVLHMPLVSTTKFSACHLDGLPCRHNIMSSLPMRTQAMLLAVLPIASHKLGQKSRS